MQVHKAFVLLALAAIVAWGSGADDAPVKIGVVDIDQAISSTKDGRAAREELARKQREAEAQIQPMIERYQAIEDDIKQKRFALSDEALFQKNLEMAEMRNKIENKTKELDGQLQLDQRRIEAPLMKKLVDVVESAGKEAGFTMILRRGSPGLLYTREALDITDLIIEKYNQKG